MRDRFGATNPRALALRFHAQTGGSTLTAQQPENNIVRVAIQALSAVSGGAQSLHTNSFDEALALPTERAATIALRTQQILAVEAGTTDTADPFGGSYFIEALTDELEERARELIARIDELGGAVAAIEQGFVQAEIEASAFRHQSDIESGERVVVGVNAFTDEGAERVELLHVDPEIERRQTRAHGARARRARRGRRRACARRGARHRVDRREPPPRACARRFARAAPSARSAASCASFGVHMTPSMRSGSRIAIAAVSLVALAVPIAALAMARGDTSAGVAAAAPSFTKDVAPIIAEKCAGCHRVGGIAPFPLQTARQITTNAGAIAGAVQAGLMPPWPPGKRSPGVRRPGHEGAQRIAARGDPRVGTVGREGRRPRAQARRAEAAPRFAPARSS